MLKLYCVNSQLRKTVGVDSVFRGWAHRCNTRSTGFTAKYIIDVLSVPIELKYLVLKIHGLKLRDAVLLKQEAHIQVQVC